jgi:hypothetical protein
LAQFDVSSFSLLQPLGSCDSLHYVFSVETPPKRIDTVIVASLYKPAHHAKSSPPCLANGCRISLLRFDVPFSSSVGCLKKFGVSATRTTIYNQVQHSLLLHPTNTNLELDLMPENLENVEIFVIAKKERRLDRRGLISLTDYYSEAYQNFYSKSV